MTLANLLCTLAAGLVLIPALAPAQTVIQDNFTTNASSYSWTPLRGACLTAGDGTGTIPACVCTSTVTSNCLTAAGQYYAGLSGASFGGGYLGGGLPDYAGQGALRLTNGNGYYQQSGGIYSNFTYPSANGLQVSFTTYAYHGDSGGTIHDGADGLSFQLVNPTVAYDGVSANTTYHAPADPVNGIGTWTPYDIGATGGSLGYDCSDEIGNYRAAPQYHPNTTTEVGVDGVINAYVGVGMDEYGNFENHGDNAGPQNNPPGVKPSAISIRGPGNVAWDALAAYSVTKNNGWYPSTLTTGILGQRAAAVHNTCNTGTYWNYSNPNNPVNTGVAVADYTWLAGVSLPTGSLLANENATQRSTSNGNFPTTTTGISAVPIQYTLTITPKGILNLTYSYNGGATTSVISNADITSGGLYPLPQQYAFGFAGSTGGSSNIHEVSCFEAQPSSSAASSAGLNEKQSAEVQQGTQVYFAYYNPNTWAGYVTSVPVVQTSTTTSGVTVTTLSLGTPGWDASCVLTGNKLPGGTTQTGSPAPTCKNTGAALTAPQATSASATGGRQILTYNTQTGAGVPFEWANLGAAQVSALSSTCVDYTNAGCNISSSSTTVGKYRLNYLRGDRTYEAGGSNSFTVSVTSGTTTTSYSEQFRARVSVLGDVVDSSPTWVGPPIGSYGSSFTDSLYPTEAASYLPENTATTGNLNQYPTWAAANATRTNVVYVGANDGMLHGFSAGAYSNLTTYNVNNTVDTGQELLAYVPGYALNDGSTATIVDAVHDSQATPTVDLTSPYYGHNWFVDAPPGTGDLYYGGAWHTWLVSGFGPGGQGVFALDITNPNSFAESNAASLVVGEWTATTLPLCANTGTGGCAQNLGDTYGAPQIRRFHSGQWGFVFGNGIGSTSGDAGIFIALVNPTATTPTLTFYYLSTSTGSTSSPNGITYVTPADLDGDHTVDYVYAGDIKGNVWRFDLTSQTPTSWAVTPGGALFSTGGLPISTKIAVASAPAVGGKRTVVISFGTGRKIPQTLTNATSYATGTQYLFGIWDWNMNSWNSKSTYHYASLTGAPTSTSYGGTFPVITAPPSTSTNLTQQVITDFSNTVTTTSGTQTTTTTTNYATVTDNAVCWYGSSACTSGNTSFGWYMSLPNTNEQIVFNPTLQAGYFIVNSLIPAVNQVLSCQSTNPSGYTYAINPVTGGGSTTSFFGNPAGTTNTTTGQNQIVSGEQLNGTGTVSLLTVGGSESQVPATYLITQTSSGSGASAQVNPAGNVTTTRLTWKEIR
jgi:type IV pilus assembly protein PilY1